MKISAFVDNPTVLPTDIIPTSKGDASVTVKTEVEDLADFIANDLDYAGLRTISKKLVGAINEISYKELTDTLEAGSTSITFTDSGILTTSTFEFYTDVYGLNPKTVTVATGSVTLTFEAQTEDVSVKVRFS